MLSLTDKDPDRRQTRISLYNPTKFSFSALVEPVSARVSYARRVEVYGENEPSEYFFKVLSGAVRNYKVLSDGRRQVYAFHLPGDFFGWETTNSYSVSAETICDSQILVVRRNVAIALADEDERVSRCLASMTGEELRRARAHVLLLLKTARERVAGFVLEMSSRSKADDEVDLPMGRQDIADYLGLTIETVSRSLAELESAGAILLVKSRRIILQDRKALCSFSI